jgi:Ca2+-binding RTX toxin-like protein
MQTTLELEALYENIEGLQVTGSRGYKLFGTDADNALTGNAGNNQLDGKSGDDTLTGGAGNDLYFVDSEDDAVV